MDNNSTIATSKKVELSLTLPSINFANLIKKIKEAASVLALNIYNPASKSFSNSSDGTSSRINKFKMPSMKNFKFKKDILKFVIPAVFGVLVIAAIVSIVRSLPDAKSDTSSPSNITAPDAIASIKLDRKFAFPLLDEKGKEVGTFDYVIQSADLQKQIIVQGQRATAIKDRVFLILNLKITNNLTQTIQLNTRDYLRLVVESNKGEQLALDIHNDPVEVQAISTKYTRVGIALDEKDLKQTIQLKVGEINGDKQNIDLNFKY